VFWVISVYFNIRNTLPKFFYIPSGTPCIHGKGKAIPLQAWTDPEGSRRLRLPYFRKINTGKWQGCQPYASAAFTLRKYA
jgi:hypothetical protein